MRSTGEPVVLALPRLVTRAKPRYGGYLVHLGVAVIAVGVISSHFYQTAREATLPVGSSFSVGRYQITHEGVIETRSGDQRIVSALLQVSTDGGAPVAVSPAKVFYDSFPDQPATHVAIETTRLEDLYLVLAGWGEDQTISLVATVNPMVSLIWLGGIVLLAGTLISLWPDRVLAPRTAPVRMREAVAVEA